MLELKNICYKVHNNNEEKEVLKDISLQLSEGCTVITGPNGGGKSTLAKMIMGIISPDSGSVFLDGKDITSLSITDRAKLGVSFAFQQPVRFKGITVKDLITQASGRSLTISEACEYLSEVGLCAREYIDREVNASLSGGELKRIEIAMAIARGTRYCIFDEPEAGIDLWSFNNLINIFKRLLESDKKRTILIISHQERILDMADRIILVADGQVKSVGKKDVILKGILSSAECHKISGCN
jgi:Fe-S cluster assembly ATP-binding protein